MSNVRYSENSKLDAVQECKSHGSINRVSDLPGVEPNTLRRWMREFGEQSDVSMGKEKI